MAKANAEHRLLANQLLYLFNNLWYILRITRAIRKEDSIRIHCQNFFSSCRCWYNLQVAAKVMHGGQNILLDTEIHHYNLWSFTAFRLYLICLRSGDLLYNVLLDWHVKELIYLSLGRILRNNNALHSTCRTNFSGYCSGIYIVKTRNALTGQEICQLSFHLPVAAFKAELADDKAIYKGFPGLHKFSSHTVITNERIG